MSQHPNYQQIVDKCNAECQQCMKDYERANIAFSQSACRQCPNGQMLHEALMQISDAEKAWGRQDWNSAQLKKFYKG